MHDTTAEASGSTTGISPDEAACRLYLAILSNGGRIAIDEVAHGDRAEVEQLVAFGLLLPNHFDGWYTAVSPRAVAERVSSDMRAEATRLLLGAERLPGTLEQLTRAYESLPPPDGGADRATHIDGAVAIRARIAQLVSESKQEIITCQPGRRDPAGLELALPQDLRFLKRGGRIRTIYQPTVLTEPAAVGYAAAVTDHGGSVRVLDEAFLRMIIIDRSVAIIPAAADDSRAAFLTDPAAIAFLLAGFERDWARSEAVPWCEFSTPVVANAATDRVGRLLCQGLTQRAVAGRLGLSERTVAGHISRLRERYGAQTLFQLGWLMRAGRGG